MRQIFADNFDCSLIYRDSLYLVSHADSLRPRALKPTRLLCLWDFPGNCGFTLPSLGDLPDPGMEPMSPALAGGFVTAELLGKPLRDRASYAYSDAHKDADYYEK